MRARRAGLLALLAGCLLLVLAAAPASAHAQVDSTFPVEGSQLSSPPGSVWVRFGEAVGISASSLEVLTPDGRQVETGAVSHPDGNASAVGVALPPSLAKGSYVVLWHVVSADSHPVTGSFTFGYAVPPGQAPPAPSGDPVIGPLDALFRFGAFAAAVALLGGTFFVRILWPAGMGRARLRRLLVWAWVACTLSTAALFVVEGPYGSSGSLRDLTDPSLLSLTLGTIYGKLLLLRLVALAGAAAVWWSLRREGGPPGRLDAAGLALLVVESFSFGGHAGQGSWVPLAATMDALHVLAASIWLGGLAVLAIVLLDRSLTTPTAGELGSVLPRWSRVAMVAVTVLVLTGAYQAWREVGSVDALLSTTYGYLVVAKAAALAVLLVLGDAGRRWIRRSQRPPAVAAAAAAPEIGSGTRPRSGAGGGVGTPGATARAGRSTVLADAPPHPPSPPSGTVGALRRSVTAEVAIGVVVLGLTTALVTSIPARQAYAPSFDTVLSGQDTQGDTIRVHVVVEPTQPGFESVAVDMQNAAGARLPFQSLTGSVSEPTIGLGPIQFTLHPTGTGRAEASDVAVPAPGVWHLVLQIRTDQLVDFTAATTYAVQ